MKELLRMDITETFTSMMKGQMIKYKFQWKWPMTDVTTVFPSFLRYMRHIKRRKSLKLHRLTFAIVFCSCVRVCVCVQSHTLANAVHVARLIFCHGLELIWRKRIGQPVCISWGNSDNSKKTQKRLMQYTYRKGSWTHTHTHRVERMLTGIWLMDGPVAVTHQQERLERDKAGRAKQAKCTNSVSFHGKCSFLYMATVVRLIDSCFTTNFLFCAMVVKLTSLTLMSKCHQSFYSDSSINVSLTQVKDGKYQVQVDCHNECFRPFWSKSAKNKEKKKRGRDEER